MHQIGETKSHESLAQRGLAPPLLARFQNGLLYRFIRGKVANPELLIQPPVWKGVARRLAQWHALLPTDECTPANPTETHVITNGTTSNGHTCKSNGDEDEITPIALKRPGPSLWSVLQKWILALPVTTKEQRTRRKMLQKELERTVEELDIDSEIGDKGVCILIVATSTLGWNVVALT